MLYRDTSSLDRRSCLEQGGHEVGRADRTRQIDPDRSTVWFHGDAEREKAAALTFSIDGPRDRQQHLAASGEPHTITVRSLVMFVGSCEEIFQQALSTGLQRDGAERAHDRKIRHTSWSQA